MLSRWWKTSSAKAAFKRVKKANAKRFAELKKQQAKREAEIANWKPVKRLKSGRKVKRL